MSLANEKNTFLDPEMTAEDIISMLTSKGGKSSKIDLTDEEAVFDTVCEKIANRYRSDLAMEYLKERGLFTTKDLRKHVEGFCLLQRKKRIGPSIIKKLSTAEETVRTILLPGRFLDEQDALKLLGECVEIYIKDNDAKAAVMRAGLYTKEEQLFQIKTFFDRLDQRRVRFTSQEILLPLSWKSFFRDIENGTISVYVKDGEYGIVSDEMPCSAETLTCDGSVMSYYRILAAIFFNELKIKYRKMTPICRDAEDILYLIDLYLTSKEPLHRKISNNKKNSR